MYMYALLSRPPEKLVMVRKTLEYFQVRIQDLVKGGPQLLRPKVADVAKRAFCGRGPGPA